MYKYQELTPLWSELTGIKAGTMVPSVLVKFAKLLLVVALSLSIGAQWAVLQSIGWVGMLVNYSQESSVRDAFVKTFDGQHPCKLCKIVVEGRKSEKKQETQKTQTKLDLFCAISPVPFLPRASLSPLPDFRGVPQFRTTAPLPPPPRQFPA